MYPPLPRWLEGDAGRIRQIMLNLLSNAIGFSPGGGTVTLLAERRPNAVVFSVTDQGPGIPPAAKDKVFDWFETDSMGSQHRGPGLGLSLVRTIAHLHGGEIELAGAPDGGFAAVATLLRDACDTAAGAGTLVYEGSFTDVDIAAALAS